MKSFLFFLAILTLPSAALEEQEFYELADSVLKGGKQYTLDKIQEVSQLTEIPLHHRTIVEVSMLGSVEDESRYLSAISKVTDYIESGNVDWAKDYLRMQRGFIFGLLGDREKGTKDLEAVLEAERLFSINSENDLILDIMRKRTPDLGLELDSLMRHTVGNYYMDFRKEGRMPTAAFRYFNSIKSKPFRGKCLLQLRDRLGDDEYNKIAESVKIHGSDFYSDNSTDALEPKASRAEKKQENRKLPASRTVLRDADNGQIKKTKSAPINPFWYLGIGLFLGLVLAILLGRAKRLR